MALDCTKKTSGPISNNLLKALINILDTVICDCINRSINCSKFPEKLKLAEITPFLITPKKGESLEVGDYRPISIFLCLTFLKESFSDS